MCVTNELCISPEIIFRMPKHLDGLSEWGFSIKFLDTVDDQRVVNVIRYGRYVVAEVMVP